MKRTLRRLAADLLTSTPARFVALAIDVLVLLRGYLGARLTGRQIEP
jgi:hypothetical protein